MPVIVPYEAVLSRMARLRMRSVYYNSGAFMPEGAGEGSFFGWIGPDDPTIRPEAAAHAIRIPPPHEDNLATMAVRAWQSVLSGPAWIMPKSHWAFELDFGGKDWLAAALREAQIDPTQLKPLTNAAAIEFGPDESTLLASMLQSLLSHLLGSDFSLAFPDHPVICTIHHHKQLWWMAADQPTLQRLRNLTLP